MSPGGSGAKYRRILTMVGAFCDCIAWIDIVLKMFVSIFNYTVLLTPLIVLNASDDFFNNRS